MTQRDFYQVLGVERTASPAEIRAAYVRLAKLHHPDVAGNLPSRLAEVQQAYRCLADTDARTAHDAAIHDGERRHAMRQVRIQRRLQGYDRRHPRKPPAPPRQLPWRRLVLLGLGIAIAARLSVGLFA